MGELFDGKEFFDSLVRVAEQEIKTVDGDYIGDEGLLVCGKCHKRKQYRVLLFDEERVVPVMCDCKKAEVEAEELRVKKIENEKRIEQLRRDGITNGEYLNWTFDQDDRKNPKVSELARRYCDHWPDMYKRNIGLLFYGDVDGGKSFMAAAIANELLSKGVSVLMASMANLLRGITPYEDKVTDKVMAVDLLIIDEFGRERATPMAIESMQRILEARYTSGKPIILTTNLDVEYMDNIEDDQYRAMFSRLKQMCTPVHVAQQNRRAQKGKEKRDEMIRLLGF